MSDPLWVGIDLGTQSVRVQALDDRGVVVRAAAEPLTSTRVGDRHEQDPERWWTATRSALRQVTTAIGDSSRIRALAVSGTSGTIVALDASTGRPTGAAVMYDDRRGSGFLDRVQERGAAIWDRLGYRMQASWALPGMLALHADGGLPDGSVFAHQPDVITSRLAGRLLPSDLSSALKSGADLDAVEWPGDVLGELGLDPGLLNRVSMSGSLIGTVGAVGAETTGLPVDCAIIAGMTDGCAAQIAAGALARGSWNSVLGTTLVIKGSVDQRLPDPSGAVYAHRAPFGGGWFPGGASSTGAGALSQHLPGRDLDRLGDALGDDLPPIAYPLVGRGERFPFVSGAAEAILPSGPDEVVFAEIVYGVAAVERLSYDLLADIGYPIRGPILLTGGGARSDAWNRVRADMLGRSVGLSVHQEGAAGMAVLAAAGHAVACDDSLASTALDDAAARMTGVRLTIDPRPAGHERLTDYYRALVGDLHDRGWLPDRLFHRGVGDAA